MKNLFYYIILFIFLGPPVFIILYSIYENVRSFVRHSTQDFYKPEPSISQLPQFQNQLNENTVFEHKDISPVDSPPLQNDKSHFTDNTINIIKGKNLCESNTHEIFSANAPFFGKYHSKISIPVKYCKTCQKFYISYTSYLNYLEKYGVLTGKIAIVDDTPPFDKSAQLAEESLLKLCGYNVNQKDNLSSEIRQSIMTFIIDYKVMRKDDVIHYLEYFINMNGRKRGNESAVAKWKEDLYFVERYIPKSVDKSLLDPSIITAALSARNDDTSIPTGTLITHKSYGTGCVVSTSLVRQNVIVVSVDFPNFGIKQLDYKYCIRNNIIKII